MRVLVFGASITQGFYDTEGGWVNRLRKYYDTLLINNPSVDQPTVFNLGISGDTSKDVLKRFETEARARVWPGEKFTFIFSIGTNNARADKNGKAESTPEEYREDIEELINIAKKFSEKMMFVGLPPCDEKLTTPVSWRDIYYTNKHIFTVEREMRKVASEHNFIHVPTFEIFQDKIKAGEKLFFDGVHPNSEGHKLIFKLVRPELDKLINT